MALSRNTDVGNFDYAGDVMPSVSDLFRTDIGEITGTGIESRDMSNRGMFNQVSQPDPNQQRIQQLQREMKTERPTEKLNTSQSAKAAVHGSPETMQRAEASKMARRAEIRALSEEIAAPVQKNPDDSERQTLGGAMATEAVNSPLEQAGAVLAGMGYAAVTGDIGTGAVISQGLSLTGAARTVTNLATVAFGGDVEDTDMWNFDTPDVPAFDMGEFNLARMSVGDPSNKITLFGDDAMYDAIAHLGQDSWEVMERLRNIADYESRFGEGISVGADTGTSIAIPSGMASMEAGPQHVS